MRRIIASMMMCMIVLALTACQSDGGAATAEQSLDEIIALYETNPLEVSNLMDRVKALETTEVDVEQFTLEADSYKEIEAEIKTIEEEVASLERERESLEREESLIQNGEWSLVSFTYAMEHEILGHVLVVPTWNEEVVAGALAMGEIRSRLGISSNRQPPIGSSFIGYISKTEEYIRAVREDQQVVEYDVVNIHSLFDSMDQARAYPAKQFNAIDREIEMFLREVEEKTLQKKTHHLAMGVLIGVVEEQELEAHLMEMEEVSATLEKEPLSVDATEEAIEETEVDEVTGELEVHLSYPQPAKDWVDGVSIAHHPGMSWKGKSSQMVPLTHEDGYAFEFTFYRRSEELLDTVSRALLAYRDYAHGLIPEQELFYWFEDVSGFGSVYLPPDQPSAYRLNELVVGEILQDGRDDKLVLIKENLSVEYPDGVVVMDRYLLIRMRTMEMDSLIVSVEWIDDAEVTTRERDYFYQKPGIQFIPTEIAASFRDYKADTNSAESMNSVGMDYYRVGQYDFAAALFYGATQLEGKNDDVRSIALAHYNLACVISLMFENPDYNNLDEALYHLEKSFQMMPDRVERSIEDSDLDTIRETASFKELLVRYIE